MGLQILICLVIGYAFGCVQSGYFYGRLKGIDIRKYGSGNVGTTNVMRVLGKKAGYMTYICDAAKAVIPIALVRFVIFPGDERIQLLAICTGFGVVLGHNYPFYLKFRGGKGIAVTSGVLAAFDLRFIIPSIIAFAIAYYTTYYVSVGSLVLVTLFPILILIFYPGQWALFGVGLLFCAMGYWRHRENIKRLMNGTENGFGKKAQKKQERAQKRMKDPEEPGDSGAQPDLPSGQKPGTGCSLADSSIAEPGTDHSQPDLTSVKVPTGSDTHESRAKTDAAFPDKETDPTGQTPAGS